MARKSKLAERAAELEAAVAGLFTGTPIDAPAPAKKLLLMNFFLEIFLCI